MKSHPHAPEAAREKRAGGTRHREPTFRRQRLVQGPHERRHDGAGLGAVPRQPANRSVTAVLVAKRSNILPKGIRATPRKATRLPPFRGMTYEKTGPPSKPWRCPPYNLSAK